MKWQQLLSSPYPSVLLLTMAASSWIGLTILAFILLPTDWSTIAAPGQNGHLLQSTCQTCHLSNTITTSNASTLIGRQEGLCATCHPDAIRASHPSGFVPRHALPKRYKLDWKGQLTCSTCHLVHASTPGLMRSTNRGGAFCQECHDQKFFERMADHGTSMFVSGHMDAKGSGDQGTPPPLDNFSIQCMGCHGEMDGSNQVRIQSTFLRHTGNLLTHPIGSTYEAAIKTGGFFPRNQLPSEIMLPNGQLSCLSCHKGYSETHGALVITNERSNLCLKCHDM